MDIHGWDIQTGCTLYMVENFSKEAALSPQISRQKESMALQSMIPSYYQYIYMIYMIYIYIYQYIPMLSSHPELSSCDRPLHASQVSLHRKNIPPMPWLTSSFFFGIHGSSSWKDLALTLHEYL